MTDRILSCRAELADLCNDLGLKTAVEIGTHQGVFADQFLSKFFGHLTCVDPWHSDSPPPLPNFAPYFVPNSPSREFDMEIARAVLGGKHGHRAELWKMTSLEAASRVPDESVGMVYVDGLHDIPNVKADILAWWPKVQPGGILAGHDYTFGDPAATGDQTLFSVPIVVNWFAVDRGLALHVIRDDIPSWYVRKPG